MSLKGKSAPTPGNEIPAMVDWSRIREKEEQDNLVKLIRGADDERIRALGFNPESQDIRDLRNKIMYAELGNLSGVLISSRLTRDQGIQFIRRFHKLIKKPIPEAFEKEHPTPKKQIEELTKTFGERLQAACARHGMSA